MAKSNNIWLYAALGIGGYLWFKSTRITTDPVTGATATPAPPIAGQLNLSTAPPVTVVSQPQQSLPPVTPAPTPVIKPNPVVVPVNQLNNPLPTAAQIAAQGVNVTNGTYINVATNGLVNYDTNPAATHGSSIPPQFQSGHS